MKQNSPGLLFLTNLPFSHRWGTKSSLARLMALDTKFSKESNEVPLPNSVQTTEFDPGSQSKVKKSLTL